MDAHIFRPNTGQERKSTEKSDFVQSLRSSPTDSKALVVTYIGNLSVSW